LFDSLDCTDAHHTGKTMNYIEKWLTPFRMGTTSSITMQSLGKIVQRAPAVGGKIWCLYVFFFLRSEAGALFVRGVHSSDKHCVAVYCPSSKQFSAFFRRDCSFRCTI